MNISSRTPDGVPNRCPICAKYVNITPSDPAGDAPCPYCGSLLWFDVTDGGLLFYRKYGDSVSRSELIAIDSDGANSRLTLAEAFEAAPRIPLARRWHMTAFCLFMTAALFLLAASLTFVIWPRIVLHEIFGWTGLVYLQLSVLSGLRYAAINRNTE